ncbi:MAG: rane protein of unknown function [Candidatus Saccharibacteria bacterium]|nr:rane protein of unknown function [Candidatus Saccharibacteria bacterium]
MQKLLLTKIRLSTYFWIFFVVFALVSVAVPGHTFDSGALTLFSVNSFLYGFYIAPILGAQKARIEELHRIIRGESNALFSMVLHLKKLPPELRNELQAMVAQYVRAKLKYKLAVSGEKEYEALITYCIEYKGKHQAEIDKLLDGLIANQQNRTNFSMQADNKVFANEWHIMAILFSITLGFILNINIGHSAIFHIVRALLCTGLTMLILILIKLSTMTHKKANMMWAPLKKLVETNFYRVD